MADQTEQRQGDEGVAQTTQSSSSASGPHDHVEKTGAALPNGSGTESEDEKRHYGAAPSKPAPQQQEPEQKKPSKIKQMWEKTGLDM